MPSAQIIRIERHMSDRRGRSDSRPRSPCEIVPLRALPVRTLEAHLASADGDLLAGRGRDAG